MSLSVCPFCLISYRVPCLLLICSSYFSFSLLPSSFFIPFFFLPLSCMSYFSLLCPFYLLFPPLWHAILYCHIHSPPHSYPHSHPHLLTLTLYHTPSLNVPQGRQLTPQQRALAQASREAESLVLSKIRCQDYIILCVEDTTDWKHATTRYLYDTQSTGFVCDKQSSVADFYSIFFILFHIFILSSLTFS